MKDTLTPSSTLDSIQHEMYMPHNAHDFNDYLRVYKNDLSTWFTTNILYFFQTLQSSSAIMISAALTMSVVNSEYFCFL